MDIIKGDLVADLAFILGAFILLFLSKFIKDYLTPYSINKELATGNIAASVSLCGYFLATLIVVVGAMLGPSKDLISDLLSFGAYGFFGIILLNISRWINDKAILYKFSNNKEIVEDRNPGTGAVEFGSYVASGLIVAGGIHGEGGGPITAIVFFFLGQFALILFTYLYNIITPFDIHDEIERDNIAAGVAFGGTLVALGIILLSSTLGNFINWQYNLSNFALNAGIGFLLLPLIRLIFDKIIIPTIDLNKAISEKQILSVAFLEMAVAISFAVLIFVSIDISVAV